MENCESVSEVAGKNVMNPEEDSRILEASTKQKAEHDSAVGADTLASPDCLMQDSEHINQLSKEMFEKTAEYLQGELSGTVEDYKLLEEMNRATITKYLDMKQIAINVNKSLKDLNDKYQSLQPYLEQIEQIEASALKLEQAAYKLDAYSKRLEAKFKQLEKR